MQCALRMGKGISGISEEFMAALVRHSWPGNVREMQNVIERSVILSTGPLLNGSLPELNHMKSSAPVTIAEAEHLHILQTLQKTGGVLGGRNGAAVRLGLPRTKLISKMKRLGYQRVTRCELPRPAGLSPVAASLGRSWIVRGNGNLFRQTARVTITLFDVSVRYTGHLFAISSSLDLCSSVNDPIR
jgi:hypothetical protein